MTPISWLYVPGTRPERFGKAALSGADAIIIDLEDAVAPPDKAQALANTLAWLTSRDRAASFVAIRVNPLDTQLGHDDLAALAASPSPPQGIVLPKVETPDTIARAVFALAQASSPVALYALIESARGVSYSDPIAESPGLAGLMFGAADYAADLGVEVDLFAAEHARARLVNAAALGHVAIIDSPSFRLGGPDVLKAADILKAECAASRALGFHGKAAIHPDQVAIINAGFRPAAAEIARARRMMDALSGGVGTLDGKMIDTAMIRWAERILSREQGR